MTLYDKIKWVLGILMVFGLIVITNLIDKNSFVRVKDSIVTIYEDRLVAKDLIFEISKAIQEKEIAVALSDSLFFSKQNNQINTDINSFILRFEETKFTKIERETFNDLRKNLEALKKAETVYVESELIEKKSVNNSIYNIQNNLSSLSKIQLEEGRRQMQISQKAISIVELFTHIEIYILIFLAIAVQFIVMYKPKEE